jgi:outer membrane immunogenic protein
LQAGYNYQIKRLVLGVDFDGSGTGLKGTSVGAIPGGGLLPGTTATENFSIHTDWIATATATAGIAEGDLLLYGKGGLALTHDSDSLSVNGSNVTCCFHPGGPFSFTSTASDTRIGWTVGTGLAWAYSNDWSAKIEYDYLDFSTKSVDFSGTVQNPGQGLTSASTFNTNNYQHISEVKVGVNYKLP